MNLGDALFYYSRQLREAGFENPRFEVEILLCHFLGMRRAEIITNEWRSLSSEEAVAIGSMVSRRLQGEPSAYITGRKDFYKYSFRVGPGVLIPRPETELIVEQAATYLALKKGRVILDMGAGSGCIGLSLLRDFQDLKAALVENSPEALKYLRENARALGVEDRAAIFESDVTQMEFDQAFDVIVANPPYISEDDPQVERNVRRFEPGQALFSGKSGIEDIEKWSLVAARALAPGGLVLFEIGHDQGAKSKAIFEGLTQFERVVVLKDLAEHDRVVRALKRP